MSPGLIEIKSGKPLPFFVTYLGPDIKYIGREFLVEIHDVSPINESLQTINITNLPPARGLERTIVMVNSVREPKPDPKKTSSDFDYQVTLLDGSVPEAIRPELEESIKQEAKAFGYTLTNARFIYPQGN